MWEFVAGYIIGMIATLLTIIFFVGCKGGN